jgi:hypothetical protein
LFAAAFAVCLVVTGCGGDDDDDGGSTATTEAAAGDFCEVWPRFDSIQSGSAPTPEALTEARGIIDEARAAAPGEITDEVTALLDLLENVIDAQESGEEQDAEEMFGEVFAVALTSGPPIEAWLIENCPDYEPAPFEDDMTGSLGIPDADLDTWVREIFADTNGADSSSSFDDYEWNIYSTGTADEALAGCTELSTRLAEHPDASGTLKLTIGDENGEPLAVNEEITAGSAGECALV